MKTSIKIFFLISSVLSGCSSNKQQDLLYISVYKENWAPTETFVSSSIPVRSSTNNKEWILETSTGTKRFEGLWIASPGKETEEFNKISDSKFFEIKRKKK